MCNQFGSENGVVAVFSDIHSNYHALKACYDDAIKCGADSFVFLGDYVSDLAEPQRTMDLVYEIQSRYRICTQISAEEYRHQRIATTIMKHIVDHTDGIVYLHATANATPKDMYAKMGFEIVETVNEYYLEW